LQTNSPTIGDDLAGSIERRFMAGRTLSVAADRVLINCQPMDLGVVKADVT
jgi:hypothetical protein